MTSQRTTLLLAAVALVVLPGAAPPHGLPPCVHSPFRDITPTSIEGVVVGEPDAKDWGCVGERGGPALLPLTASPVSSADTVGVPGNPPLVRVCFGPAFPNPADASTQVRFALPSASRVSLVVYGQTWQHGPHDVFPVRTLADGMFPAGLHAVTWDLNNDSGSRVARGVYRAVLVVGDDALCGDIEIR